MERNLLLAGNALPPLKRNQVTVGLRLNVTRRKVGYGFGSLSVTRLRPGYV
jgi:hypothetical protein